MASSRSKKPPNAKIMAAKVDTGNGSMVKVVLRNETDDADLPESLWATPVGLHKYRLENSPFFAYGVSFQDVVEARDKFDDGVLEFIRVVKKSGNRTLRMSHEAGKPISSKILKPLLDMGCTYEGANPAFLVINVPPQADFDAAATYIFNLDSKSIVFEFADPTADEYFDTQEKAEKNKKQSQRKKQPRSRTRKP
ncbi:MAG: DUF4265 domain-containing protein [Phycisphaerales bacterium]